MKAKENADLPVIAIVGRPNIGKSSLFNAIMRRRVAIVHEMSGVTRDRVSMPAHYEDKHFMLVDTGGLGVMRREKKKVDFFDAQIREQLEVALESADLCIVMTDITAGVHPMDREVCKFLREKGKKAIVACNKSDNVDLDRSADEFASLGIETIVPISCLHKRNIRELLGNAVDQIEKVDIDSLESPSLNIAVAGRPNVGKSSIINRLLGEERVIVSDVAGTTRDAVDIPITFAEDGQEVHATLVDTAGVKKDNKIHDVVEFFSMMRTEEAIKRSNVVIFVIDVTTGVTAHDKRIGSMIQEAGKPCILVINKWDLVKGKKMKEDVKEEIFRDLPFLSHSTLMFVSAQSGTGFERILPALLFTRDQTNINVPTALLNQVLHDMVARTPPPSTGKGFFKIFYGTQVSNPPAKFVIFCNKKNYLQPSYFKFMEKTLRKSFGLIGVPVEIELRERKHMQDREGSHLSGEAKEKMAEQRQRVRRKNRKYRKKSRR